MLGLAKWVIGPLGFVLVASACSVTSSVRGTGAGGSGDASSTTSAGAQGGGVPAEGETFVGRSCEADLDCGDHPDSFCVTATGNQAIFTGFWGGDGNAGVAGGYCTRSCGADMACPDGSRCGGGICLQQCEYGSPELTGVAAPLSAEKCWGRDDLMCVPASGDEAVCMPNCGAGSDCGGRACDGRYGACIDPQREGLLDGEVCEPDNMGTAENEDSCSGLCLQLEDDADTVVATVCTSRCSLGGAGADCGGPEVGACAIPRVVDGAEAQLGDQGFCASACETHDACSFLSGMFCLDLGNFDAVGKGYCLTAEPCDDDVCKGDLVCTETLAGKVCLDDDGAGAPLIPLGSAAL